MDQMKIELWLVMKHVSGGTEKVNAVNCLTKTPPSAKEYYYEEDAYAVKNKLEVFGQMPKFPTRISVAKVKVTNV